MHPPVLTDVLCIPAPSAADYTMVNPPDTEMT